MMVRQEYLDCTILSYILWPDLLSLKEDEMFKNILIGIGIILAVVSGRELYRMESGGRLAPRMLNYQGYLTDTLGNPVSSPPMSMAFSIYGSATSGTALWTEYQGVEVNKGLFHVLLGISTPIPDTVFTKGADRWLELNVESNVLLPRTRIVSAPYAYTATYSDTALYVRNSAPDNDWRFLLSDGADTTLQMGGLWGLARAGNILFGYNINTSYLYIV